MRSLLFALPCALALLAPACGDDDAVSSSDGGSDAGGGAKEAGHGGDHDDDTEVDSGPPPIRCSEDELAANDKTDGGALEITFLTGANPRQYENHCATVKVGASVVFSGGFKQHPLQPAGGDSPNPIPYTPTDQPNNRLVVTMPTAGTFGYECEFHPTSMYGAIRVVP